MKPTQILLAIIAVPAVILALIFGGGAIQRLTADWRGETSQIEKTKANGQYRIAAYDHFYDLCSSVQAAEDRIVNQLAERKTATPDRAAQIDANITAARNVRDQLIRRYNTDARKEATSGQFRASDLPYQLNTTLEENSCGA